MNINEHQNLQFFIKKLKVLWSLYSSKKCFIKKVWDTLFNKTKISGFVFANSVLQKTFNKVSTFSRMFSYHLMVLMISVIRAIMITMVSAMVSNLLPESFKMILQSLISWWWLLWPWWWWWWGKNWRQKVSLWCFETWQWIKLWLQFYNQTADERVQRAIQMSYGRHLHINNLFSASRKRRKREDHIMQNKIHQPCKFFDQFFLKPDW